MIIAFDYGERRIGIAVSDETGKYAIALKYITNNIPSTSRKSDSRKFQNSDRIRQNTPSLRSQMRFERQKLFNKMLYYIHCYYPEKIIVGIPKVLDIHTGQITESTQAKAIRRFFNLFNKFLISKNIICPIEYVDETLTSKIALENLQNTNASKKNIAENVDSESARILLQEYLDKLR